MKIAHTQLIYLLCLIIMPLNALSKTFITANIFKGLSWWETLFGLTVKNYYVFATYS